MTYLTDKETYEADKMITRKEITLAQLKKEKEEIRKQIERLNKDISQDYQYPQKAICGIEIEEMKFNHQLQLQRIKSAEIQKTIQRRNF